MSTTERETQREELRRRIVEAARDIVSEKGLDALSMRALGDRIGHSAGTIYLYFQDKDELLRTVMVEGFKRLGHEMEAEVAKAGPEASALERTAATGRAYARFAIENTGYFKAMFQMPRVASLEHCPRPEVEALERSMPALSKEHAVSLLRQGAESERLELGDPSKAALVGWGLIHGLTSLYVSGHLSDDVRSHEEFMELIEGAMQSLRTGWEPRER